jgi:hypothetical protein
MHRTEWIVAVGLDRTKYLPAAKGHKPLRQFSAAVAGFGNIVGELLQVLPCIELFAEKLGVTNDHGQKSILIVSNTAGL